MIRCIAVGVFCTYSLSCMFLCRENEVLKVQLKKYVGAVQMLKREGSQGNDGKQHKHTYTCMRARVRGINMTQNWISYLCPSAQRSTHRKKGHQFPSYPRAVLMRFSDDKLPF